MPLTYPILNISRDGSVTSALLFPLHSSQRWAKPVNKKGKFRMQKQNGTSPAAQWQPFFWGGEGVFCFCFNLKVHTGVQHVYILSPLPSPTSPVSSQLPLLKLPPLHLFLLYMHMCTHTNTGTHTELLMRREIAFIVVVNMWNLKLIYMKHFD